jgi:uncharacterized membrane protein
MSFLVPNRYKLLGAILAPTGFSSWLLMQSGAWTRALTSLFGADTRSIPPYHGANVAIALISFFGFLLGLYCLAFAREKVEDEMIQRLRVESFQFAAFIQILAVISGFAAMIFREPGESGLLLFFIAAVALFWISYIVRFNYILHMKPNND